MSKTKSVRLNTFLRDEIVKSIIEEYRANALKSHGFNTLKELGDAMAEERQSICRSLWYECYGDLKIFSVPHWATNDNPFSFCKEGDSSGMLSRKVYADDEETVVLPSKPHVDLVLTSERYEEVTARLQELSNLYEEVDKGAYTLRREVSPVIESFNTTKQLVETWPSVEKFLPANIADPDKGISLPALSLSRLEEKINGTN